MVRDLISNTTALLALCALYELNIRLWADRHRPAAVSAGVIFGAICIAGMSFPVEIAPGVLLDGRVAVLGMAGVFGGILVGAIAGAIAGAYRLWLGGGGAVAGLGVIASSVALGLAYRRAAARGWIGVTPLNFLAFGLTLHLVAMAWSMALPAGVSVNLRSEQGIGYLLVMATATALLGVLIQELREQRRTKEALMRSEALRHAITRASPDVLIVVDEDGRYLEVISPEERLLYARASDILGKTMADVLPPADAERFLGLVLRAMDTRTPQSIEYEMSTLDGRHVFEGRAQALDTLVDGKRAAVFVARDITERATAEHERRIAAIAFEAQQGMLITDADQVILRVNGAYSQIMGFAPSDVVGTSVSSLRGDAQQTALHQALWSDARAHGKWEGEVWERRSNGDAVPLWVTITAVLDRAGTVTNFVVSIMDITQRKSEDERIRSLAFHDQLTSAANRGLLLDRLQHALALARRNDRHGALLFIDLDDFKSVNDHFGHHCGDLLLKQVAARLADVVRSTDTVARVGGDEFVLLLENLDGDPARALDESTRIAAKALQALEARYDLDGQSAHSGGSIGIALFKGRETSADAVLKQADDAMYEAKRAGKNTIRVYGRKG